MSKSPLETVVTEYEYLCPKCGAVVHARGGVMCGWEEASIECECGATSCLGAGNFGIPSVADGWKYRERGTEVWMERYRGYSRAAR